MKRADIFEHRLLLRNRKTLKSRLITFQIGKHLNHIPSSNSQFSLNPGFQISLTHCTNSSDSQQHRLLMPVESSASVFTKHHSTQLMPKPRPPPIHSIVDTVHSKATINTTPPPKTTTKPPLIHSRTLAHRVWCILDTTLFITTRKTSFTTTSLWPRKKTTTHSRQYHHHSLHYNPHHHLATAVPGRQGHRGISDPWDSKWLQVT